MSFKSNKKLGFGLMRLPKIGEEFDLEQIKKMVDTFLEAGYNYFDTAWLYKGSEEIMRKALVDRHPRESYTIATKMAAWMSKSKDEALDQYYSSLKKSNAGYFDYYLLHNLGEDRTAFFDKWNLWDFVQEEKKKGRIRHVGFSIHSSAEDLESILQNHPEMEFVQLQINYADWDDLQIQSRRCYEVARKYNKPVIIMEPVKGGLLANPPPRVADVLKKADPDRSYASWAIRFAASLDGVFSVLSGMSNMEQLNDNIASLNNFQKLSDAEQQTISEARKELQKVSMVPCTFCDYCAKVCPENIGISATFNALNAYKLYGDMKFALGQENWFVVHKGKKRANQCINCGKCEKSCPQHLAIRKYLKEASDIFQMDKAD